MFENNYNEPLMMPWNKELGEDYEHAKEMILLILKEQKVSLAKIRYLFYEILVDIEKNNPIAL